MASLEEAILLFFQNIRHESIDPIMIAISWIGNNGLLWIVVGLALLLFRRTRHGGADTLVALAVGFLINNVLIKNLVARVRPYDAIEGLLAIVPHLNDWSFPSGHTCASFAAATALALAFGKPGAWSFVPAVAIAISRLYVGVHYPSDVIVGAMIGAGVAFCVHKALKKIRKVGI